MSRKKMVYVYDVDDFVAMTEDEEKAYLERQRVKWSNIDFSMKIS